MSGLFVKTEIYLPTLSGFALILAVLAISIWLYLKNIHGFLACQNRVEAKVLVVEGWMRDYALRKAVEEFHANNYGYVITTGGPLDRGTELSEYNTFAELTAISLKEMGIPEEKIITLPGKYTQRDRTYNAALDVAGWMDTNYNQGGVNLFTVGVHARRSLYIYKKVLPKDLSLGVISVTYEDYLPEKWWESSIGVRTVLSEQIAYIYFRLFWDV